MANEAGLQIPVGFTEQKALAQLARIEAQAIKAANKAQQSFVRANQDIGRSFSRMGQQGGTGLQNVSYQLQDIFVQISSGQGAAQALSQQMPQLLSGFGALGAALGLASAVAIPLAASLFKGADGAKEMAKQIDSLGNEIKEYKDALASANASTEELARRYGAAAMTARDLWENIAKLQRVEALDELNRSAKLLAGSLGGVQDIVRVLDQEASLSAGGLADTGVVAAAQEKLRKEYGLTVEKAREINKLATDLTAARSMEERATALRKMATLLTEGATQTDKTSDSLRVTAKAANDAALQALELSNATETTAVAARDLATAASSVSFGDALSEARSLTDVLDATANLAKSIGRGIVANIREGDTKAAEGGILDLIKRRESGGDYNVTLDNGAYADGARDLVNMTINEVLDMQRKMLAHPANKKNSSAAGAYQIVRTTLQSLVRDLGLSGNELYSKDMQDRLASELLRRRRGQGLTGLRNEWEGLKHVDDATIQTAMGQQSIGRTDPEVAKRQKEEADAAAKAAKEASDEIKRKTDQAKAYGEQLVQNLAATKQTADLEKQRNAQVAVIQAGNLSETEKAAAIARVNAEMERQLTIMAYTMEMQQRGLTLNDRIIGGAMTYREAIDGIANAEYERALAGQQANAQMENMAAAQEFAAQQTQALKDGLVDAIVEGENFGDVLENVAKSLAKAALQAALFGQGPMAQGGGGLFGSLFGGMFGGGGGGVAGNDMLSQALRGAVGFRANGGPVSAGMPYVVGEHRAELFVPNVSGTIIPRLPNLPQIAPQRAAQGSRQVSMTIDVRGATGNTEVQQMVAAGVHQGMNQVRREVPGILDDYNSRIRP